MSTELVSPPAPLVPDVLAAGPPGGPLVNGVGDDRQAIQPGDRVLLIVENDLAFARVVLTAGREKGFKGLVTSLGAAALAMAREYMPDAITLDMMLPDIAGERVLQRLKNDTATRHIPVFVVSTEDVSERVLDLGAARVVIKPVATREALDGLLDDLRTFVEKPPRDLLVIAADPARRSRILRGLDGLGARAVAAGGREALAKLRDYSYGVVVLDPHEPGLPLEVLAESLSGATGKVPVIVTGDHDLPPDVEA